MDGVELLSPAGDFTTALAAFEAGADAVYCGLAEFSARAFAKNLGFGELRDLVAVARARNRKVYVTFNTLLDEDALDGAIETLAKLEEIAPDALIVQDLGIAKLCRDHFPGLALHASTQLVAHNLEGVLALKDLGFSRVVLARELSLEEIASIARRCGDTELECFIHGALCYSVSGLCLFGAMEKGRSGNRGRCPYCCRLAYDDGAGGKTLPFSMKDLRLGEDVRKLVDAGVVSLKIEGRMKSALYVGSVTRYYRQILDRTPGDRISVADLETVFSRRTTELYLNGKPEESVMDPDSLGHLGTPIGTVKRVTRDRDGLAWLRFHTARALEKHDGLQFEAMAEGRHLGLGIVEMRQAISRHPVFEVAAGTDVEILLPEDRTGQGLTADWSLLRPGMKIYCSMSNAVKRMFPTPSFRPSDYTAGNAVDITVSLASDRIRAVTGSAEAEIAGRFEPAKNPEKTFGAVEKAFSKLGDTDYRLGRLTVEDPDRLFAPMSVLNDLRRDLVERLDASRDRLRREKIEAACDEVPEAPVSTRKPCRTLRIRAGQRIPDGDWDEVIIAVNADTPEPFEHPDIQTSRPSSIRLALPVYTAEPAFNRLRSAVKRFLRAGYVKWECSDLATLRMLKALGVDDLTADWTLYAFNSRALAQLAALGVKRFVASPENSRENLQYLAESGYDVDFLVQQSTPLFVSLTKPGEQGELAVYEQGGLWVTTKPVPRTFATPDGVSTRLDLSWDPPAV